MSQGTEPGKVCFFMMLARLSNQIHLICLYHEIITPQRKLSFTGLPSIQETSCTSWKDVRGIMNRKWILLNAFDRP